MRVHLSRGCLAAASAGALVTSANDSLVGNLAPMYWRFISRTNVDSTIRKLGGEELIQACLDIEPLPTVQGIRRDITRWTSGVKHGACALVRCPAGAAVATKASGALRADWVIHAVAPDSEFGYEGLYTGGDASQKASGITSQQFSPPDQLLLSAFSSAFSEAARVQASTVCCPALGIGVKGWKPAISAALGLEAVVQLNARDPTSVKSIEFVIGGVDADITWREWLKVARALLGLPSGIDSDASFKEQASQGRITWELLSQGHLQADVAQNKMSSQCSESMGAHMLALDKLPEIQEMLLHRARGFSGMDIPLTAEQELAATRRRTTR
ncbi:hypothetical protein AB1Y20_008242 [Prymnesium parvum]|uniref:Macro domain-containing protein n=1 Tax=Prymnesium parvum TaxID=97485 RepID=A0AB34IU50_PRYPA